MDRERFDALTRVLATQGSRRAALGAVLGGLLLGETAGVLAKHGKGKHNGKARGKGKHRGKARSEAKAKKARANQGGGCCSNGACDPGAGAYVSKCCFQGQDLTSETFKGANASSANFADADLSGVSFRGANVRNACFVDADLTGADFTAATSTGAIYCRTITDTGEDNSGCDRGTPCCPTCDAEHPCGEDEVCCDGRCFSGNCCTRSDCTLAEPICRRNVCVPCTSDSQCGGGQTCCGGACVDIDTDEQNCGRCGRACDNPDATCVGGECVIVVRPADMNGWQFYDDQNDVPIGPSFELGPGDPPRGDGSAELKISGNAEGKLLSANILTGTPLADFATLEYTFWVTSSTSATGPSLQLGIDYDLTDPNQGFQGRMVYVPGTTGPVPTGQWITTDVLADNAGGNWFFTRPPGNAVCTQANSCNFSEILGLFPNIGIHPIGPIGPGAGFGFIGFKVGSGEGAVDANVDSITIKLDGATEPITVYDFEPNS
jgi:hypothetical protein